LGIAGIRTNAALFQTVIADAEFQSGAIHTRWLDERLASLLPVLGKHSDAAVETLEVKVAMIAAALWHASNSKSADEHVAQPISRWRQDGRREQISRTPDR